MINNRQTTVNLGIGQGNRIINVDQLQHYTNEHTINCQGSVELTKKSRELRLGIHFYCRMQNLLSRLANNAYACIKVCVSLGEKAIWQRCGGRYPQVAVTAIWRKPCDDEKRFCRHREAIGEG